MGYWKEFYWTKYKKFVLFKCFLIILLIFLTGFRILMLDVVVNLENTILRKSNLEKSELNGSILINTSLEFRRS